MGSGLERRLRKVEAQHAPPPRSVEVWLVADGEAWNGEERIPAAELDERPEPPGFDRFVIRLVAPAVAA